MVKPLERERYERMDLEMKIRVVVMPMGADYGDSQERCK